MMSKTGRIVSLSIVAVLGLAVFLYAESIYGFAEFPLDPMNTAKANDAIAAICYPGGFSAADALCDAKIRRAFLPCYAPFQAAADKADCVRQTEADLYTRYYPQLATANYTPEQVTAWAVRAAGDSLSFDYQNVDQKLDEARKNFTPAGWKEFLKVLDKSGLVPATKDMKWKVSLKLNATPEMRENLSSGGLYTWYVQFPVTFEFEPSQPGTNENPPPISSFLVLKIVRSAFAANSDGIGISQWMTAEGQTPPM